MAPASFRTNSSAGNDLDEKTVDMTGALVIGDTVLLGAVPMEDMDLVISSSRETITVNPKNPNIPSAIVKHCSLYNPDVGEAPKRCNRLM